MLCAQPKAKMKTHDPKADALYVRFSDTSIAESEEVSEAIIHKGKIVAQRS
jgi:uncharacterized protein YuzE